MALNKPRPEAPWGEYVPNMGPLTVEEFAQLPDEDGWTYELYQGRLIRMPGPGGEHGIIQRRLLVLLANYLAANTINGEIFGTACYYFALPQGETVLCPDISYVAPPQAASIVYRGSYVETLPDLVIEISSPNDFRPKTIAKVQDYLAAGIKMVWVLWPGSRTIEVWRQGNRASPTRILTASDVLDGLDVISGFQAPLQSIFGQ